MTRGRALQDARDRLFAHLAAEGHDPRVLDAMRAVPRERFVQEHARGLAYEDDALAIGSGQTISQPAIVATMTAVLALLRDLGVANVRMLAADGVLGAPQYAPYDAILVAAAAPAVQPSLLAQLRDGGRIVLPVGTREQQELVLATRTAEGLRERSLGGCRFVPLVGADIEVRCASMSAPRPLLCSRHRAPEPLYIATGALKQPVAPSGETPPILTAAPDGCSVPAAAEE